VARVLETYLSLNWDPLEAIGIVTTLTESFFCATKFVFTFSSLIKTLWDNMTHCPQINRPLVPCWDHKFDDLFIRQNAIGH
jgi:hypothetical protein